MYLDRVFANDNEYLAWTTRLGATGAGVGHIYYVIKKNEAFYADFLTTHQFKYSDGSNAVYNDIQSALNACVAARNDYVIVMPSASDYDISATLTIAKRNVHLICPAGLGFNGMGSNAARIHQNAAYPHITITGDDVEVAGLFLKSDATARTPVTGQINLSGTRWHTNIHDNFFGISATAASGSYGILAAGASSHFSIWNNYFTNYNPGETTGTNNAIAAFIGITSNSSTRGLIKGNIMHTGGNTTVTAGIHNAGLQSMFIIDNILNADQAGTCDMGIMTVGINAAACAIVARNLFGGYINATNMVDPITGPTNEYTCLLNYTAVAGGTVVDVS